MKTNVIAFKKLIKKYESITLKDIEIEKGIDAGFKIPFIGSRIARRISGFGRNDSCSLCIAVNNMCYLCLHSHYNPFSKEHFGYSCTRIKAEKTYDNIVMSWTSQELLKAFRNRAKYMRKILDKLGYKQP